MNLPDIEELRQPISDLLARSTRVNSAKPERYWYPLSLATYDVEEILGALDSLCSFRTTMWDKTLAFERAFGDLHGGPHAVMVNSGSSADLLAMLALANPAATALERGDEVLVPALTWPTQIWSALMAGFVVRLVDADVRTMNMDLADLEDKVGDRTRCLFATHIMGNPCSMDSVLDVVRNNDLVLVEDCCEALGAEWNGRQVGTFGAAGTFSFFFSHHLTTMEGGMVITDDERRADLLRLLRAHGWSRNLSATPEATASGIDPRYTFLNWGMNVRPTELQAAFGLVQLTRLAAFDLARQQKAAIVQSGLEALRPRLTLMQVEPQARCSWFALPMVVGADAGFTRDELAAHLEADGVETRPIVAGNIARHPVADVFPGLRRDPLPGADALHDRGLYVGLHPIGPASTVERLVELLVAYVDSRS